MMFHLLCVASHIQLLNVFLAVLDVDASAESVEAVAYVASVYGVDTVSYTHLTLPTIA